MNMCFSAEASFTAAVVLTAIGCITLKQASSQRLMMLASIPLIFGIQQFFEGVLWLYLRNGLYPTFGADFAKYYYLLIAFVVWPTWIPLSVFSAEGVIWRRRLQGFFLALGILVSLTELIFLVLYPIIPMVEIHSIQYRFPAASLPHSINVNFYTYALFYAYAAAVLVPLYLSSIKNAFILAVLTTITILIANYFYVYAFTSVWCFFSAIVSLIIYKIIRDNRLAQ